jgi:hypothetical protein
MRRRRPIVEDAATTRGRDASDTAGEFHFIDSGDYVAFTAGLLNKSGLKYKDVATAASMSPSTASNLAGGKTKFPRFSTIAGTLGALGYETVIRAGAVAPRKRK